MKREAGRTLSCILGAALTLVAAIPWTIGWHGSGEWMINPVAQYYGGLSMISGFAGLTDQQERLRERAFLIRFGRSSFQIKLKDDQEFDAVKSEANRSLSEFGTDMRALKNSDGHDLVIEIDKLQARAFKKHLEEFRDSRREGTTKVQDLGVKN